MAELEAPVVGKVYSYEDSVQATREWDSAEGDRYYHVMWNYRYVVDHSKVCVEDYVISCRLCNTGIWRPSKEFAPEHAIVGGYDLECRCGNVKAVDATD